MGKWTKAQQKYYRSEAGKAARRKYQQSDRAKATRRAYYLKRKAQKQAKLEVKDQPTTAKIASTTTPTTQE